MINKPNCHRDQSRLYETVCLAAIALIVLTVTSDAMAKTSTVNCQAFTTKVSIQYELASFEKLPSQMFTEMKNPVSSAETIVQGAMGMGRSKIEAQVPGLHDWAVLQVLRSWQQGRDYQEFKIWSLKQCIAEWAIR